METRHKTILVADDDTAIVDSISSILNYAGYEVLFVYDGTSVMESVKAQPDLVLLDIMMEGHSGVTVCKQLKRMGRTQNIPVLMMSARTNGEQLAREAGADGYLAKPFDMEVLQSSISDLLSVSVSA
ncbi:response regulator transcription factor [Mucilaginibacter sp. KACC 22063]|uniref:response regulator transcription factor n=1 Tax=Mucilaginibacter sp. KACC 22063 TaxID=3025666 RepID=UPI002366ED74|nr:response regulator transcription factor [Mucilaginibacter sp. KACC 22063]WDF56928.1 response regulator transcription factor [Mucilaginibacter sp. KACC 22063]